MAVVEKLGRRSSSKGTALDLIRSSGPISRVELAEMTGLTQATISTVVRGLITDGLISETGRAESTGGKPRMHLQINPGSRLSIGVHVGADHITYVVTDLAGTVVGRLRSRGPGMNSPIESVGRIATDVDRLIAGLDIDRSRIVGLGLVTPGPIDKGSGSIQNAPTLAHWTDFPLARAVSTATGLPCVFDNDATAAAIGEYWMGATSDHLTYASVYMGVGIGAGIVIDGSIYHGELSNVGELGHVTVDARGRRCPCGNVGCVELYAAPPAVVAAARTAVESGTLDMVFTGVLARDFETVATLAMAGDATALGLIDESAEYLASAIVSMVNLIDLHLIVLAGSAFSVAGSIYASTISATLAERVLARSIRGVDVRMSVNGDDAAALGAATMVLQENLSPRSLRAVTLATAP
ncbi:ROK family transcriptional regulator [Labedella gwakjiensis]|uniref:ROK family transcriptional regulator n=1 Tax=Labedella gwakjiensis TaxID=390269 RepID=A0ABY0C3J8_9MICO|nr:ROK family transcriptional regulator [Labedella gwakjiensis]